MGADWRARLASAVGPRVFPAAPELLLAATEHARPPIGTAAAVQLAREVPAALRRLLDAETQLAALRDLLADLLAELDEGDELTIDDVRRRLDAAGIRLDAELEHATALRAAQATA